MTFNNGALQYNGYVVANKMNGQGKLTFDNGDVYEGQFKMEFSTVKEPTHLQVGGFIPGNLKQLRRWKRKIDHRRTSYLRRNF